MAEERRTPLEAWGEDVPLRGPDAPKNDGKIKHLIEYLLTVYERFGNTAVTADLQWGASALHKRDEQKERIAELEARLSTPSANAASVIEECAKVCEQFMPIPQAIHLSLQRNTLENVAQAIRSLKGRSGG